MQRTRAARRSATAKQASPPPGLLAIVVYDRIRLFEFAIASEIFALERPGLGVDWYRSVVVAAEPGPMHGIAGTRLQPTAPFTAIHEASTIVIPGWRDPAEPAPRRLLEALREAARRGARIVSICSGVFPVAAAGLLQGKRATTHWLYIDELRRQYPEVVVEDNVLYVDEGNIITSAGSAAGIDACMHIVRRDFGAAVANKIARRMVIAAQRHGGQMQYTQQRPGHQADHHGEHRLADAMAWARARIGHPLNIGELASRAAMSERTFLRQFRSAVGLTPLAWLTQERILRARELLECSDLGIDAIGARCGYESPETFRAAFHRVVGVAPGRYRSLYL